ncbi:restriction endonuclease subunit S [Streptomyces bacillaris]|uniref:restriction endonuclease subunit S n=1 Tax=Streptomyces bacillaris TaxID=68179 RepID=UPI0036FC97CB
MTRWKNVELGSVATIVRSAIAPSEMSPDETYLALEHIERGGRIIGSSTIAGSEVSSPKFSFNEGDVLYGKLRPYLGKIAIPGFSGVCSTDILPVRPGSLLDGRYLLHFLRQSRMVELANSRTTGANLPRISPGELARFKIPLPSLAEQKRLASALDQADALRVKRRQAIALLDDLVDSIFHSMFGDPRSNPMAWETCRFGSLIALGPQNGLYKPSGDYGSGVPILRIDSFQQGSLSATSEWRQVRVDSGDVERYGLANGDIIVNRVNSRTHLGKSAMVSGVDGDAVFESNMMRLRVDEHAILPVYAERFLGTPFIKAKILEAAKDAVNQSSVNQGDIKGLPFNVPPIELQQEFDRRVRSIRRQQALHRTQLTALHELFASIQQRGFADELWDYGAA